MLKQYHFGTIAKKNKNISFRSSGRPYAAPGEFDPSIELPWFQNIHKSREKTILEHKSSIAYSCPNCLILYNKLLTLHQKIPPAIPVTHSPISDPSTCPKKPTRTKPSNTDNLPSEQIKLCKFLKCRLCCKTQIPVRIRSRFRRGVAPEGSRSGLHVLGGWCLKAWVRANGRRL